MRKKIKWFKGKIEDISDDILVGLDELDSYMFQIEDKIKVFLPEDKIEDIEKLFKSHVKNIKKYVESGDKGCGLPGSIEWHTTQIKQKEPIDIGKYVKDVTGKDINVLGRIDYTIKRAIKAVEDHLNG